MVATTALEMSMNIPDVDRIVQWDFPLKDDIGDLWQRFGRVARDEGKRGIAIFFASYWAFNELGYCEKKPTTTST